jgi:hypothetical protein
MTSLERSEPALVADERTMLIGWLEYHRATLAWKCDGLTPDQLRIRAVPPSTLSLLGLVRHMAEVERGWFRSVMAAEHAPEIYCSADNRDGDFNDVAQADAVEAFASWAAECDFARDVVDRAADFEVVGRRRDEVFSLRWVMTHMIEEYARHNGHADLLRQCIDGDTGD